jgi:hypothetical protein
MIRENVRRATGPSPASLRGYREAAWKDLEVRPQLFGRVSKESDGEGSMRTA